VGYGRVLLEQNIAGLQCSRANECMGLNLPLSFPLLHCDLIGIGYGRQFSFEMGFGARLDGVKPRSLTFSTSVRSSIWIQWVDILSSNWRSRFSSGRSDKLFAVSCSSTALMGCFLGLASESLWGCRIGSGSNPAPLIFAEPRDQLDLTTSDLRFDCLLLNEAQLWRSNHTDKKHLILVPTFLCNFGGSYLPFLPKFSNGLGSLTCQIRGN
jgi:hypothetical protein